MPRCPTGQVASLQEDDVTHATLHKMVGDRTPNNAAADDDDFGAFLRRHFRPEAVSQRGDGPSTTPFRGQNRPQAARGFPEYRKKSRLRPNHALSGSGHSECKTHSVVAVHPERTRDRRQTFYVLALFGLPLLARLLPRRIDEPVTGSWVEGLLPMTEPAKDDYRTGAYKGTVAQLTWIRRKFPGKEDWVEIYIGMSDYDVHACCGLSLEKMTRNQFLSLLNGLGISLPKK